MTSSYAAGHPQLRAGDADRDAVQTILSQAYAEGRLTHAEHDQRITALWRAVTVRELDTLVADVVPVPQPVLTVPVAPRLPLTRLLHCFWWPSVACVLLWRFASPGLFWPAWVIVYTGLPLLREVRARRRRR